jgi:hypothetical protein
MTASRFDPAVAHQRALATLAAPPAQPHIVRPEPAGELVGTWALPLELCPTLNALAEMPSWARQQVKKNALAIMLAESQGRLAPTPLPGRPLVRALRLSSVEPDRDSGWPKVPVDRLCIGKRQRPKNLRADVWLALAARMPPVGLGWLRDDRPSALDLRAWWEPAPSGHGLVYLELWTGDAVEAALRVRAGSRPPRPATPVPAALRAGRALPAPEEHVDNPPTGGPAPSRR